MTYLEQVEPHLVGADVIDHLEQWFEGFLWGNAFNHFGPSPLDNDSGVEVICKNIVREMKRIKAKNYIVAFCNFPSACGWKAIVEH